MGGVEGTGQGKGAGDSEKNCWRKASSRWVSWHVGCRWENRLPMPLSYLRRYHLMSSCFSSWCLLQLALSPHLSPLLQHFSCLPWQFISQAHPDLRRLGSGNGSCWAGVGGMGWRRSEQVWSQLRTPAQPTACLTLCQGGLQHSADMGWPSGTAGCLGRNTLCSEIRDSKVGGVIH